MEKSNYKQVMQIFHTSNNFKKKLLLNRSSLELVTMVIHTLYTLRRKLLESSQKYFPVFSIPLFIPVVLGVDNTIYYP